jgi:hypothetical protein
MEAFMKIKTTLILVLVSLSCLSQAATQKEFGFRFSMKSKVLELKISANSEKQAFENAAQECFNYFSGAKGREKISVSQDFGMDLVDTCANPRRI